MIEIELPDGTIAEFPDGTSPDVIKGALQKRFGAPVKAPQRNPDGTYGQPPEGMVTDPRTGQMTERTLMANDMQMRGVSNAESLITGGAQGATFGGADEAIGGINAIIPGEGSMADRYAFGREYARAMQDASRAENPYFHGAGEIGGGVATALTYGLPAMAGRSLGGAMGAGALMGGLEGSAYGFLSGEGGLADRGKNALTYGAAGAALGGAIPPVTALLGKGARAVGDFVGGGVDAVTGRASTGRANRAIAKTLAQSGRSADDIDAALAAAAREGQTEFRAVDALGYPGQRRASAIVRSGGDSSADVRRFLDERQLNQSDRVSGFVSDAFDGSTATAKATRTALTAGRKASADLDFGSIRAAGEPVDIRGAIDVIDGKIAPFEKANISSPVRSIMKRLRRQLAGKGDNASYELSDFDKVFAIRKELRDNIDSLYRQGKNELAGDLKQVRDALDQAMETSSSTYRKAMDDFRKSSRVIDAVETGQSMVPGSVRHEDAVNQFQRLSPGEQAAARVGFGDKITARVADTRDTGNAVGPLNKVQFREKANAIAADPDLLGRRIARENEMVRTRELAAGGSRTADNIEDIKELAGADMGFLANVVTGRWGAAAGQVAQGLGRTATGMNDSTRQRIAKALLAQDATAFRAALKQVESASMRKSIVDAIARIGGIQNVDPDMMRKLIQGQN